MSPATADEPGDQMSGEQMVERKSNAPRCTEANSATRVWRVRRHCVPILVLVVGIVVSFGAFSLSKSSEHHSDQLLLRQEATQGSLILSSFIGVTPAPVTDVVTDLTLAEVTPAGWDAVAGPIAKEEGYSTLALFRVVNGRLAPLVSTGPLHHTLGTAADDSIVTSLEHGRTVYAGAAQSGSQRWLTQWFAIPAKPGLIAYAEEPVSTKPFSLNSLPGHPFSGVQGALYAGYERPSDLVFSSTLQVPLRGDRAVTTISNSTLTSTPAELTSRVGAMSAPGQFLLVVRATTNLSGSSAALVPWVLLATGILSTLVAAALLELSESRRLRVLATMGQLEERSEDLDRAVELQQSTAARFSAMVRSSSDLTTVISSEGHIQYQSPSSSNLLGLDPDNLVGRDFNALVHPDDAANWLRAVTQSVALPGTELAEGLRLRTADGSYVSVETRLTNLLDEPAVAGIVLNSRDVTDRMRLEDELRHQAFHDSLTGLANRALFEDRLELALVRMGRVRSTLGVLFLDLDDFKAVNDGRGHKVGDELLQEVSERLRDTVRAGDTLARIGGDEFAILVESEDPSAATETAERIMYAMRPSFSIGSGEARVRASIGVVTTADREQRAQELLRDADVAMYAAKNAGKERVVEFHPGLHDEVIHRLQLEVDLGHATDNEELIAYYQPVVNLASGEIVGVEALMRWEHPERGMVMPDEFIPVAESTGLIVPMGRWMLMRACQDARFMQRKTGHSHLHLAVNLSAKQLDDPGIVNDVKAALQVSGLAPRLLTLEITESVFMSNPDHSREILAELKQVGVTLSIDDFGTGYSSLGYLNRLPVDELKIDRSFVAAGDSEKDGSGSLVHTIVRLAEDFGLQTVAEGIETPEELAWVRESGCQLAQGFLFARPMGLVDLQVFLSETDRVETDQASRVEVFA